MSYPGAFSVEDLLIAFMYLFLQRDLEKLCTNCFKQTYPILRILGNIPSSTNTV